MIFAHCKQPKTTVGQQRDRIGQEDRQTKYPRVLTLTLHDSHTEVSTVYLCVCVSQGFKSCAIAVPKDAAESEAKARKKPEMELETKDRTWSSSSSQVPRGSLLLLLLLCCCCCVVVGLIFDFVDSSSILSCNHEFILLKIT